MPSSFPMAGPIPGNLLVGAASGTPGQVLDVRGNTVLQLNAASNTAPELHYVALNSEWLSGVDVANNGGAKDFVVLAKKYSGSTYDVIYAAHNGTNAPVTIGIGVTPPAAGTYRLQISPDDTLVTMGGLGIRVGPSQTGKALSIYDSSAVEKLWIDKDFAISGAAGAGLTVKADVANGRVLQLEKTDGTIVYGIAHSGNSLRFSYVTGGADSFEIGTDGKFKALTVANFSAVGAYFPHAGAGTPTGGQSGEVRVGTGKIWVNDAGTWKSAVVA